MAAFNVNDWTIPRIDTTELERIVEIQNLRVESNKLQILLNETRTSHKEDITKGYSYPVLIGYKRELVEKELASIKVKLILLGYKK